MRTNKLKAQQVPFLFIFKNFTFSPFLKAPTTNCATAIIGHKKYKML